MTIWRPESWQQKISLQIPPYLAIDDLQSTIEKLNKLSPIVKINQIRNLKSAIALASRKQAFLLQMGDCAESFADCNHKKVTSKIKFISVIAKILANAIGLPVIQVGRIAGQYAKPRSNDYELHDDKLIPVYRGDIINKITPTLNDRKPDPSLMLKAYICSKLVVKQINKLMQDVNSVYTSHEALLLYYEQALTRKSTFDDKWYNLSTHFPWLGMRTAVLETGHLEYLRGINNPVAIKVGNNLSPQNLVKIIDQLNPSNESGKITLIHRFGSKHIEKCLPQFIEIINKSKKNILWCCDPMHGNTETTSSGQKTRRINNIIDELVIAIKIHKDMNSYLGGIHLEATNENVVECLEQENDFPKNNLLYKSLVDPRLNFIQTIQIINILTKSFDNKNTHLLRAA